VLHTWILATLVLPDDTLALPPRVAVTNWKGLIGEIAISVSRAKWIRALFQDDTIEHVQDGFV
jgi:hypothetical protein